MMTMMIMTIKRKMIMIVVFLVCVLTEEQDLA